LLKLPHGKPKFAKITGGLYISLTYYVPLTYHNVSLTAPT